MLLPALRRPVAASVTPYARCPDPMPMTGLALQVQVESVKVRAQWIDSQCRWYCACLDKPLWCADWNEIRPRKISRSEIDTRRMSGCPSINDEVV